MARILVDAAIAQLIAVLREGFEGPPERWSYFTDTGREAGLLGTLGGVGAAEASRPIGGTSVAAHAYHAAFGAEASAAWIRGDRTPRDWNESWTVSTVDEARWATIRDELRRRYEELREAIASHAADSEDAFGGAVGAVAHAAYHLGAIRQKLGVVRGS